MAKKYSSLQLIIDYQGLNEVTIKNKYPLPLMDDLFDKVGKARYFSKIYLTFRYNQIQVYKNDIPKTAFQTKFGSYECEVLNFSMTNTPATFSIFIKSPTI